MQRIRQFQSTLPARGATVREAGELGRHQHFNPRSPHGERLLGGVAETLMEEISIHAPRTGSDLRLRSRRARINHFNPRSPHGERPTGIQPIPVWHNFNPRSPHGERRNPGEYGESGLISIHAPRTGSDPCRTSSKAGYPYFNPRSPHGERHVLQFLLPIINVFQSTLPARGATRRKRYPTQEQEFQSTLPARGATLRQHPKGGVTMNFNPRSPHGERRAP